jgi:hypothetical protein
MTGSFILVMITVSDEEVQPGLEMVQINLLVPEPKFMMELRGSEIFAIVADPECNIQVPVPIAGVFADKEVELPQIF